MTEHLSADEGIGKNISIMLEIRGLAQKDLADRMGASAGNILHIIKGKAPFPLSHFEYATKTLLLDSSYNNQNP